jgi:tetratricopeptide (TPR) repeat protein
MITLVNSASSVLTVAMVLFCLAIRSSGQGTDLARQALDLQQAGDFEGAAGAYRALLKDQPNDVAARSNLGVVLVKLGRYDEAIGEYEAADRLAPADPRIGLNLALAYSKSGRVSEAARRLEPIHQVAPETQQVTLLLADCYLRLGNNGQVIALLQPLETRTPDDLSVAYMLGVALIREKRIQEGQVLLEKILSKGDSAETRFLLGMQMFESGDYPAAVKQLGSAVALNPAVPELQSFYGRALLITGDPDGASTAFRAELATNPYDFEANLGLGQIDTVRTKYGEAVPLLRRALLARPQSTRAMAALGECLLAANKPAEARPILEKAVEAQPASWRAHVALADTYAKLNMPKEALQQKSLAEGLKGGDALTDAPKVDDLAPEFALPSTTSGQVVSLSQFRGKTPVVLVFGSYSCPNLRSTAGALAALNAQFGKQAQFLLVYIREAHADDNWESSRNVREGVNLKSVSTMGEKQERATMCTRKLHLPFTAVVDGLDGSVEKAYHAWPSRALVVGTDGRVLYTTRLTELDFHSGEMQQAVRKAIGDQK